MNEATPDKGSKLPLSQQEKTISMLHDTIDQLEARLSAVLGPPHNTEKDEASTAEPGMSPLAEQLHTNNRGIARATYKLHELTDRLEC